MFYASHTIHLSTAMTMLALVVGEAFAANTFTSMPNLWLCLVGTLGDQWFSNLSGLVRCPIRSSCGPEIFP